MVAFLNSLPQDRKSTLVEKDGQIEDTLGAVAPVYSASAKEIKLINTPLTTAEKDSLLSHYTTNLTNEIDLILNAYNTGTIQVYYAKPPKLKQVGRVHWSVTNTFRS